jgi:hypothetical protein
MDCSALPALSEISQRTRATALHRSFLACGKDANANNFDILAAPPSMADERAANRRSSIVRRGASASIDAGRWKTRLSNFAVSVLSSRGRPNGDSCCGRKLR